MKHVFYLGFLLAAAAGMAAPQPNIPLSGGETKDSALVLCDDPWAAQLDSAAICFYEEMVGLAQDFFYTPSDQIGDCGVPVFDSEIYRERLAELDVRTPFDLTYNKTIEAFIHLYVSKKRELSALCLGRGDLFFPMIEEALDRHSLPIELKYLAVVESGLNPKARSRAGATGLWQFMYGTGRNFGLHVDSYVDERCDPAKATEAACKYLRYLYGMFGDWNLALAAYNCGEGRVTKAIRRSGGKRSYWEIYPYLPPETRGYVPAFIAVNYLFAHANDHNISALPAMYPAYALDSIHVDHPVSFSQVAALLNMPEAEVAYLNPAYRSNIVPAYGAHNVLWLPKEKVNLWVNNTETITTHLETLPENTPEPKTEAVAAPKEVTYYTVRSGDYLGAIAARHGCSVRQLQDWNNMSGTTLRVGQKLALYGSNAAPGAAAKTNTKSATTAQVKENSGDNIYYNIQAGDTLWDIAKTRGVSLEDLKRWNSHMNFKNMKPGDKIIVGKG